VGRGVFSTSIREDEAVSTGQDLFDEYNAKYFGGRLPRYRVRFVDFSIVNRLGWEGECFPDRRLIQIRKQLPKGTNTGRVLLHEMCHIGSFGHGRRFRDRLRRLADQGVAWAADEIAMYEAAPTWNQEMANLRGRLDEAAGMNPRPTFTILVTSLAADLGMSPSRLRRAAPWVRAAWAAACRDADFISLAKRLRDRTGD
jgi:hypothetical protein